MRCPHCKSDHLDEGKFAINKHIIHTCARCKRNFRSSRQGIGNPLARYGFTLQKGKLSLNAISAKSATLPHAFMQKARAIYDAHKHNVDQFVDNVFAAQSYNDVVVQVTPIKNVLYINCRNGREAHHRTY
jgi:hypothetical protein